MLTFFQILVAAGFPSGLYDLESKKREISFAIKSGAKEIDIVISRYLVLGNRWQELYNEIRDLKKTCDKVIMKTILSVGECGSLDNVYKASMVALMAGTDYIKTSTGELSQNQVKIIRKFNLSMILLQFISIRKGGCQCYFHDWCDNV